MKKQKGITLIALIITIIVMLILVGVTINVAINGGLLTTAQKAATEMNKAQIQERAEIVKIKLIADLQEGNDTITGVVQEYKNRLEEEFGEDNVTIEGNKVTVDGKYDIVIKNSDLDIKVVENSNKVELAVLVKDIERKNTEEDSKIYASTFTFNISASISQEDYVTNKQEEFNNATIKEKRKVVLEFLSEAVETPLTSVDEYLLIALNEMEEGKTYPTLDQWLSDTSVLALFNKTEGKIEKGQLYYYIATNGGTIGSMTEEEFINAYYTILSSENDFAQDYEEITTALTAYVVKDGTEEVIKNNINLEGQFRYSLCENGEYEFVVKNTKNEEVLREKIIVNDILAENNPVIVAANGDWEIYDDGINKWIKSYTGQDKKVVFPLKVGNDYVNKISSGVLENNTNLEKVIIPEGYGQLGATVFRGCTNLEEVSLPSTCFWLGQAIFVNCTALTEITLPKSITSINYDVFEGCTALTNIYLEEGSSLETSTNAPWRAPNATVTVLPAEE